MNKLTSTTAALALASASGLALAGDWTANASFSNNYLWRGLTQTENEPAISGGIDYAHDSGFYVGTWVSNVSYATPDTFSYEHDLYIGYAGEYNGISYDIGYLYYNYDEQADYDFGEIYGSLGYMGFSVTAYVFAHGETDEDVGIPVIGKPYDLDFGNAFYISGDYSFEIKEGLELGAHVGYHEGDFVDAFNFLNGADSYVDWNVSVSKAGFSFMVSGTDLSDKDGGAVDLFNNSIKYVVSYTLDIDL